MKRKIKFRVWNLDKNKYHFYDYDKGFDNFKFWDLINDFNHARPEQFIGVYDKNGKEIYEGDIIKCYNERVVDKYIKFNPDTAAFELALKNGFCIGRTGYKLSGIRPDFYEIVGNIFENKELLETK